MEYKFEDVYELYGVPRVVTGYVAHESPTVIVYTFHIYGGDWPDAPQMESHDVVVLPDDVIHIEDNPATTTQGSIYHEWLGLLEEEAGQSAHQLTVIEPQKVFEKIILPALREAWEKAQRWKNL